MRANPTHVDYRKLAAIVSAVQINDEPDRATMRDRIRQAVGEYAEANNLPEQSFVEFRMTKDYSPEKMRDKYAEYYKELEDLYTTYNVQFSEVWLSWWDRTKIEVGTPQFRELLSRYEVGAEQPFYRPDGSATDDVRFFGPSRNVAKLVRDFYRGTLSNHEIKKMLKTYGDAVQTLIADLTPEEQLELRGKLPKKQISRSMESAMLLSDGSIGRFGRYHYEMVDSEASDWVNDIGFTISFDPNNSYRVTITRRDDFSIFSKTVVTEELVISTDFSDMKELDQIVRYQIGEQLKAKGHMAPEYADELSHKLPPYWPVSEKVVAVIRYKTDSLLQKVYFASIKFEYKK